jgi:HK97 gp10 family phage protein
MAISVSFKINTNINKNIDKAIEKGLTKAAVYVQGEAKKRAVVDTGNMRANVYYKVVGFVALIYNTVKYSIFIEYGTIKMQARPFMRPALYENIDKINRIISSSMKEDL